MSSLGKRLRFLRKIQNETQEQIGELIGMSESSISRYENDLVIPPTQTLVVLAQHFNVKVDYIIGKDKNIQEPGEKYIVDTKIPLVSEKTVLNLPEYIATEAIDFIPFQRADFDDDVFAVKIVLYGIAVTLAAKRRYNKGDLVLCDNDGKITIRKRKELKGEKTKIVGAVLEFID